MINKAENRTFTGLLILGLLTLSGCGSEPDDRFDHLNLIPTQEVLSEFSLGNYMIPIAGIDYEQLTNLKPRHRVQIEFALIAEIKPENEDLLLEDWQHYEGQIRDEIIRTCRHASFEDLDEHDLVTLKSRILKAIEPIIGPDRIQRLVLNDLQLFEL